MAPQSQRLTPPRRTAAVTIVVSKIDAIRKRAGTRGALEARRMPVAAQRADDLAARVVCDGGLAGGAGAKEPKVALVAVGRAAALKDVRVRIKITAAALAGEVRGVEGPLADLPRAAGKSWRG